jgi:transposase
VSDSRRGSTRGVARRNAKLTQLREQVRKDLAIVAVDLAAAEQAAVVADHDSRVLGRRKFRGPARRIEAILDWAAPIAAKAGFAGVVVACEPTGHRWKVVLQAARNRGLPMVCVQPMLVARAREAEDYTGNKSDYGDAVIIARLVAELRCYIPYLPAGPWARLRHLGVRRAQLLDRVTAARQCLLDLLECAWPSVLGAAAQPAESLTWRAALTVSASPRVIAAMSLGEFTTAVRRQLPAAGGKRISRRIAVAIHAAAAAPGGVEAEQDALAERAEYACADWLAALAEVQRVEAHMVKILDELHLTHLVTTIPGIRAVGAAAILAETGDPGRYDDPRAWVKHAGLAPRANESGTFRGATRTTGRGRSRLRTAAWRAIWGALPHNPVYTSRYAHLTGRGHNKLNDGKARSALAAALLRQLFVVITQRVPWDPVIASGAALPGQVTATAA